MLKGNEEMRLELKKLCLTDSRINKILERQNKSNSGNAPMDEYNELLGDKTIQKETDRDMNNKDEVEEIITNLRNGLTDNHSETGIDPGLLNNFGKDKEDKEDNEPIVPEESDVIPWHIRKI
ncbi:hypothetical protein HMI55_001102 [Coelomomyces lativittatus]|nr:hypothetical protein HMI55_001102 [Coelomomyces lativittatus]